MIEFLKIFGSKLRLIGMFAAAITAFSAPMVAVVAFVDFAPYGFPLFVCAAVVSLALAASLADWADKWTRK